MAAAAALTLTSCAAATTAARPVARRVSAAIASPSAASARPSPVASTPVPVPVTSPAAPPASPQPVSPARSAAPSPPESPAAPDYPVANPPSGTPWQWPQGTPPSCTPTATPSSGAEVFAILMENLKADGPWNGQSEDNANCFAYAMGTADFAAKTVQLLVRDTADGVQKAFTGHLGDVISLGRFTLKVEPPDGAYGSQVVFQVGIYWA